MVATILNKLKNTISVQLHRLTILFAATILSAGCVAQKNRITVMDYLQMPGPVVFDNKSYGLAWSSHPADNFYKQEYLVKGDSLHNYKTMILLDVITGTAKIKDIVGAKMAELQQLKATNPIVNYQTFENAAAGEYMIDFLLSANTPDGKQLSIVERNVYRYRSFTDKAGKKGILLFGVSTRNYGDSIKEFLTSLKANKNVMVNLVSQFKIPQIVIDK